MKHWVGGAEGCSSSPTRQLCPGQAVVVKKTTVMLMVAVKGSVCLLVLSSLEGYNTESEVAFKPSFTGL